MVVAHGYVLACFGWTFALSMRSKGKTSSQVVIHKTRGEEEGKGCVAKRVRNAMIIVMLLRGWRQGVGAGQPRGEVVSPSGLEKLFPASFEKR